MEKRIIYRHKKTGQTKPFSESYVAKVRNKSFFTENWVRQDPQADLEDAHARQAARPIEITRAEVPVITHIPKAKEDLSLKSKRELKEVIEELQNKFPEKNIQTKDYNTLNKEGLIDFINKVS